MEPMKPMKPMDAGPKWWPDDLGDPSTSGGQNDVDYAFFPRKRRLAVQKDGQVSVYDSGDHDIGVVSRKQGSRGSLTFRSQNGNVNVDEFRKLQLGAAAKGLPKWRADR